MNLKVNLLTESGINLKTVRLVLFNIFDQKEVQETTEISPGQALAVLVLDLCKELGFSEHEIFSILKYYKSEFQGYGAVLWPVGGTTVNISFVKGPSPLILLEILDNRWARVYSTAEDRRRHPEDLAWDFKEQEEGRPETLPLVSVSIALTVLIERLNAAP